jgi:hypothetical protein
MARASAGDDVGADATNVDLVVRQGLAYAVVNEPLSLFRPSTNRSR